ncbi:MAG: NAD(P)-binding protein, partial [Firmicutes bacterium]|nr:NAD(P)-binding protein [Bacillota bacterium]
MLICQRRCSMTYVIVGAGAAGMAAAETLRQLDAESSV